MCCGGTPLGVVWWSGGGWECLEELSLVVKVSKVSEVS
jgi:hypothetical protein